MGLISKEVHDDAIMDIAMVYSIEEVSAKWNRLGSIIVGNLQTYLDLIKIVLIGKKVVK